MALVIVAVLAVVVGLAMPSSGHVERSLVIGKDIRQVYDVLNNFRRFSDYAELTGSDPTIKYDLSGEAYGPGAEISWTGAPKKAGSGKLTIASATPGFNEIDTTVNHAQIVWNLDSDWRGSDKHFTLDLEREGRRHQLTKVTWAYDVKYGFNLLNRYSNLYIHGAPDAFIQYSLTGLQDMLASVKNVDYSDLVPYIEQVKPTPVLMLSTKIEREGGLDALNEATNAAVKLLQDTAKKLNVNVTGPRILVVNNYGDQTFTFDIALPIDSTTITVAGQSHDLTAEAAPKTPALPATAASAEAPASAASVAAPAVATNAPGSTDKYGRLIIDQDVRATMMAGGAVLKGEWNGTYAGVPQT
ncbi:MAG TPA: polyketide cyclase, partial [Dyella sp.]|nr:polyketide cyclase [Dyella sp.]